MRYCNENHSIGGLVLCVLISLILLSGACGSAAIEDDAAEGGTIPEWNKPPEPVEIYPENNDIEVEISTSISVVFSKCMNEETIDEASFLVENNLGRVDGNISYDTVTRTAVFDPSQDLQRATRYTVTLKKTMTDSTGISLLSDVHSTFKTLPVPVFDINLGDIHTCVLTIERKVKCWGYNEGGVLGILHDSNMGDNPGEMGNKLPQTEVASDATVDSIASGDDFNCVLLGGAVKCWGSQTFNEGQLGLGHSNPIGDDAHEMGDNLPWVNLGDGITVVEVDSGGYHSCARLLNGSLKCWGYNINGELGIDSRESIGDEPSEMGEALKFAKLGDGYQALDLSVGNGHACTVSTDGKAKCWGNNNCGQLGVESAFMEIGNHSDEMLTLTGIDLGNDASADQIAAGHHHTCILLKNGSVKCWGKANSGQLGLGHSNNIGDDTGEMGNNLPAVDLGTGRIAISVAAGGDHTCAILDNGLLKCWGGNAYGQLGLESRLNIGNDLGEMGDNLQPVDLGSGRTALKVALGKYHTCALLDNRTVKCWGYNNQGQLGYGDRENRGDESGEMGDNLPIVDIGAH